MMLAPAHPVDRSRGRLGSWLDGYAVDWAIDDNNFLVCRVIEGTNASDYSSGGGRTSAAFAASTGSAWGGTIAVSNSSQIVVAPGQNAWPKYSTNGGASWNDCVSIGITRVADGTENGFGFGSTETRRHILCADKDVPGTFYIYNYGPSGVVASRGLWKSTDGGAKLDAGKQHLHHPVAICRIPCRPQVRERRPLPDSRRHKLLVRQ